MSPEAIALAAVKRTETWMGWCDPSNLGTPQQAGRYLENRLDAAFLLGVQKGQEIAANRVRDLALGKTQL